MLGSGKYAIAAEIDKGDYLAFGVETKKVRSKEAKGHLHMHVRFSYR